MRLLLLFMFFTGAFLIVVNQLVEQSGGVRVQYQYLSRDLDTYLREEPLASTLFKPMYDGEEVNLARR